MTTRPATPRTRDRLRRLLGRRSPAPLNTQIHVTSPTPPAPGPTSLASASLQVPTSPPRGVKPDIFNSPKDRWATALLGLTARDQALVQKYTPASSVGSDTIITNLGDILEATQRKRELVEDGRWTLPIMGRRISVRGEADKVIRWLDRFKQAGDVAVNADPVHAGLPWAAIRLILQAVVSDQEQLDALFSGLERIVYVLSRCKVYSELYLQIPQSSLAYSNVEKSLDGLYALLLQFLVNALRVLDKNTGSRALHAFWKPEEILAFEQKCAKIEDRVEIEINSLERALKKDDRQEDAQRFAQLVRELEEIKSIRRPIEILSVQVESVWIQQGNALRAEVLTWISIIGHLDQHQIAVQGRTHHTGNWLFQHHQYQHWYKAPSSMILWLHGIPGAGKTKLVTRIVDEFSGNRHGYGFGFFYCDRSDETRRDAECILRSYVKQLAVSAAKDEIHQSVLAIYNNKKHSGFASSKLTFEESERLLHELIEAFPKVTLVLDALDECREKDRAKLIKVFGRLVQSSTAGRLKVFISSRRNDDIKRQLREEANLGIEATDNEDDIRKFVLEKLEDESRRRANEWLPQISTDIKQEIANTLFEKSHGMFQWAALQIGQLLDLERESDIRARLGRLPEGLQEAYDDILSTIKKQKGSKPVVATRAFTWIMVATVPLELDVLLAAVCQDAESDEIALPDIDKEYVIGACQNLVTVDANNRCHFAHLSVEEYFETTAFQSRGECDRVVVNVCLALLLNIGDGERRKKLNPDAAYSIELQKLYVVAAAAWAEHLRRSEKYCCQNSRTLALVMNFLGMPEEPSPAYISWYEEDLRPTPPNTEEISGPGTSPIIVACAAGLLTVLKEWRKIADINANIKTRQGESLLYIAFKQSQSVCVDFLLDNGADITEITKWDAKEVLETVKETQDVTTMKRVVTTMLQKHPENTATLRNYLGIVLVHAAYRGYEVVVQFLLEHGANPNHAESLYGSPLCAACLEGHIEVVARLLDSGADVNLAASKYENALGVSCWKGSKELVSLLLSRGADTSSRPRIMARAESQGQEPWKKNINALLPEEAPNPIPHVNYYEESIHPISESESPILIRRYSDNPFFSESEEWGSRGKKPSSSALNSDENDPLLSYPFYDDKNLLSFDPLGALLADEGLAAGALVDAQGKLANKKSGGNSAQ
ncbi:hypothetical protein P154DRAFT_32248 [Amniculicola lignicola CBS 123094]|uniref:NACHT domain-containing protein n=1 Tax=Amniculicola lignicola CBS 123094 TaxID=1392246 RepID=A0A6A5VY98_9PLEO|nr:hypothetical protein P154DRAFT_32248 [Amniculicola lignicola CBS 123094]